MVGYVDKLNSGIHHTDCLKYVPLDSQLPTCSKCSKFRENVLRGRLTRHLQEINGNQSVEANSHTNFRCLTPTEKCERMKNMAAVIHTKDQQIARLHEKINRLVSSQGVLVDRDISNDLVTMMKECSEAAQKEQSNPFMKIFWDHQLKAASLGSTRQMRWHPAIIRWCLYLHHRSSGCYKTLRNSGLFHLPSERTLQDYRHFSSSTTGFSKSLDEQLLEQVGTQKPENLAKYVGLVLDEMYVKESLVYDKHTGSLTGYSDMGDVNNLFAELEEEKKSSVSRRPLAKCVLVFMVRGLFNRLKFPYVHFPTTSTTGAELFPILRKMISRLTRLGLRIMTVTCDGASENRLLFSLHDEKNNKTAYKINNVYTNEGHPIFFISDPSHLIKTIRNCFSRGKLLVCIAKFMVLMHLLYYYTSFCL